MRKTPYYFDEFFASGLEETMSPFLSPRTRLWGKNLPLRTSLLSAFCLLCTLALWWHFPLFALIPLIFVYFLSGTPALIQAIQDIRKGQINIDVLMTLAALLSILIGSGIEGGLLLVLFELSGAMESTVIHKTRTAVLSLHKLAPKSACLVGSDGHPYQAALSEVSVGSLILVKTGEVIPLDGVVEKGSCYISLVHLTGENKPVSKTIQDLVPAGATTLDGSLTIRVTRSNADSTLSHIIRLITEAQETKPKIEQFLDRFGKWYASSIILLSLLFVVTLPLFGVPWLGNEGSIYRSLAFLIAASPCALIIAVPTAYLSAISSCAKKGILLKGGIVLDSLAACRAIAFDKTGTLTTGNLICSEYKQIMGPPIDPNRALAIAAALERNVIHPVAESIISLAKKQKTPPLELSNLSVIPGMGLSAQLETTPVAIGRLSFVAPEKKEDIKHLGLEETTCSFLKVDTSLFHFSFEDQIKQEAKEAVASMRNLGLEIFMLTGDHRSSAAIVAKEVGITSFYATLSPDEKLQQVTKLSEQFGLVMVGDGLNDAPALARASVGISMGKIGSRTAIDASDIVLLGDDLSLLDFLYKKSKKTVRIVRENLTLALGVIVCATTPALLGWIPLWLAVILHEGGTLLVGLNSLRLLWNNKVLFNNK